MLTRNWLLVTTVYLWGTDSPVLKLLTFHNVPSLLDDAAQFELSPPLLWRPFHNINRLDRHGTAQESTNIRDLKSRFQCFRQPILILVICAYRFVEKEITRISHSMSPNWMSFSITKSLGIFRNYCKRRGSYFSFLRNEREIWGSVVIIYLFVIP